MDNSCPLILDISSDEESGFVDAIEGDFTGDREDHDWLSKLLDELDGNRNDDSDEVVLVNEVISNPKKPRLRSSKSTCEIVCHGGDGDDDDCVILDCEPKQDKLVKIDGVSSGGGGGGDDSEDLEIVGEKGEVACRDFPHARHLCANFSFASTPHEVHCSQCHCYVCDLLAPCAHWGTGISSSDHCHASEKEDHWKTERKRAKRGYHPVSALPGTIDPFASAGIPRTTQVPALLPPLPNSLLQNQAFRQVPCRPRSKSSTVNVPIASDQSRSYLAGRVIPSYKAYPQYSHQRLHTAWRSDTTSMGNDGNPVIRGPQVIQPTGSRRPGFFALPNSRHVYDRRYHRSPVPGGSPLKRCPGLNSSNSFNCKKKTVHCAANSMLIQQNFLVPQSLNVESTNYIHSHPQIHSQPNSSYVVGGPTHSQPDMPSQPLLGENFEDGSPFHSQVFSQSNLEVLDDTVPPLLNKVLQPNFPTPQNLLSQLGSNNEQMHSTPVIPSPPNQSSQFQESGEHASLHINPHNTCHQSSQAQSVANTSHADFDVNWNTSLGHNISSEISVLPSATSTDNFQRQSTTENDCSTADSFCPASVPPTDCRLLGTDNISHFPVSQDPDPVNFCFDNWIMENQPFPGDLEVSPMSPDLSVFSPEPASIDAGTRFDF